MLFVVDWKMRYRLLAEIGIGEATLKVKGDMVRRARRWEQCEEDSVMLFNNDDE
jgi:hypothetical protein